MKRQQKFITILSLIVALTGLPPVVAADAGRDSGGEQFGPVQSHNVSRKVQLTASQMDNVHAGGIWEEIWRPITQSDIRSAFENYGSLCTSIDNLFGC